MAKYSLEQFETDMAAMQPRPFDLYVLPAFLIGYAVRFKGERGPGRWPRRILFTAGVYMAMRNYARYKAAAVALASRFSAPAVETNGSPSLNEGLGDVWKTMAEPRLHP